MNSPKKKGRLAAALVVMTFSLAALCAAMDEIDPSPHGLPHEIERSLSRAP